VGETLDEMCELAESGDGVDEIEVIARTSTGRRIGSTIGCRGTSKSERRDSASALQFSRAGRYFDSVRMAVQVLRLADMSRKQALRGLEVLESLVVGVDCERVVARFEESRPMSSSLDHREQFAVMGSISTLDISGLARPIGHRAVPIWMKLGQNGGNGEPRGVRFDYCRKGCNKMA